MEGKVFPFSPLQLESFSLHFPLSTYYALKWFYLFVFFAAFFNISQRLMLHIYSKFMQFSSRNEKLLLPNWSTESGKLSLLSLVLRLVFEELKI